jgi:hypothetical protein
VSAGIVDIDELRDRNVLRHLEHPAFARWVHLAVRKQEHARTDRARRRREIPEAPIITAHKALEKALAALPVEGAPA